MKRDFTRRFGFLANDLAKLYDERLDRLACECIGLLRAQCRLLGKARSGLVSLSMETRV